MNTGRHRQLGKHSVSAVCFPRSAFVLRGTRGSPCLRPYYIMNYCLASFARTKPIDPRRASSKSFQKKKNNNNNCCETRSKTFFHGKRKKRGGMIEAFGEYLLRPPVWATPRARDRRTYAPGCWGSSSLSPSRSGPTWSSRTWRRLSWAL